jgi:hypothetical protein
LPLSIVQIIVFKSDKYILIIITYIIIFCTFYNIQNTQWIAIVCCIGLLLENEKTIVLDLNDKFPRHSKHWLPVVWAASIVTRARKEGRIRDDFAVKTIIDELNKFRGQCGLLLNYDSISVPLVYTQVNLIL